MATITSNGTGGGDWSAVGTWAGGVVPGDTDDVVIADGDTVVLDIATVPAAGTLGAVTQDSGGAGTGVITADSATVNAINATSFTAIAADLLTISGVGTITINADLNGGGAGDDCVLVSDACTITVNGNLVGGSGGSGDALELAAAAVATINGNVTGGSVLTAYGLVVSSTGAVLINGTVYGTTGSYGLNIGSASNEVTVRALSFEGGKFEPIVGYSPAIIQNFIADGYAGGGGAIGDRWAF